MPEATNPIFVLPYQDVEFSRKRGGGSYRPPLVPVTDGLRAELASRIEMFAEVAAQGGFSSALPMPLKIRLRPGALAKSNRPYTLLSAVALHVSAGDGPGELIVEATTDRLRNLASAVRSATSSADVFAISTIESLEAWDLVRDVFGLPSTVDVEDELRAAIGERALLRLAFFPWVVRQNFVPRQVGISAQSLAIGEGSAIAAYLVRSGVELQEFRGSTQRPVAYVTATSALSLSLLAHTPGLRSVGKVPSYATDDMVSAQVYSEIRAVSAQDITAPENLGPVVGVLDHGIAPGVLDPFIVDRHHFDPPGRVDPQHGTFVGGLVAAANSLNGGDPRFPVDSCRLFDAQVLPAGSGVDERTLFDRLNQVVRARAISEGIRVWNCSFGAKPIGNFSYSTLAQDLDQLSDELGVLFVVAAGNNPRVPPRPWPPLRGADYDDALRSPSEAVRVATVGARSHRGGAAPEGAPSSYSRRGPNFASNVKPEVGHWAGDVSPQGHAGGYGVHSVLPGDVLAESVGTSFAAPLVSATAASLWAALEGSGAFSEVRPELVRGLLVHSAQLADPQPDLRVRDYIGWGTPPSSLEVIQDTDTRFTTIHEVVMTPGNDWMKRPFPVPDVLLTEAGKLRALVTVTIAYAPPVNPAFGAESIRYDVSGAFGRVVRDADGVEHFNAITTADGRRHAYWEADRITDGKWSPVKTSKSRHPQGVAGGDWALRLTLTERMANELQVEQRVFVIVTMESVDGNAQVNEAGIRALTRLQYPRRAVNVTVPIAVRGS